MAESILAAANRQSTASKYKDRLCAQDETNKQNICYALLAHSQHAATDEASALRVWRINGNEAVGPMQVLKGGEKKKATEEKQKLGEYLCGSKLPPSLPPDKNKSSRLLMFWFKEVWEGNKQIIHTEDVFMHRSYMLWRNAIIGWLGGGGGMRRQWRKKSERSYDWAGFRDEEIQS